MQTHDQLVKKLLRRPGVRAEVERIEREEGALLDALLKARAGAGLTQARSPNAWEPTPPQRRAWSAPWPPASTRRRSQPYASMSRLAANDWCSGSPEAGGCAGVSEVSIRQRQQSGELVF